MTCINYFVPNPSSATALHFKQNKQVILDEWERQVRSKVEGAGGFNRTALRDAIPIFLDELFARLAKEEYKPTAKPDTGLQVAAEHGKQRSDLGSYTVEDVVAEYEILRRVLTAVLEVKEPVLNEDRESIINSIFTAVRKAVSEFSLSEKDKSDALEVSLKSQLLALREERELRENFVSALSHDLRTPLTAARMSAQILLRQRDNPGALEKLAGRIIDNLDRTDDMIRNLLDANRIKAGEKLPIKISACELNKVIRESLDDLITLYGNRFIFETDTPVSGYWDGEAIRRIIENLCGNAVKYGSAREITVRLRLLSSEVEIEISVHNWGTPIAKEDLESLFQHFRRSRKAVHEGQRGWGIGLTLVRGIAEAHGGTAEVSSTLEHGTTFKVKLPRDARAVRNPS